MGGLETIETLLQIDPGIKAIVSSGYSKDSVMSDPQQYGFSAAISKPFQVEELRETLRKVLM